MNETNKSATNDNLIFGTRPIVEALKSGKQIDKILFKQGLETPVLKEIQKLAKEQNVPVKAVPLPKLNFITRKNHQGVVAFTTEVEFQSLEGLVPGWFYEGINPVLVVLDRVSDVRNFGSIVRTVECMGGHAVIIPYKGSASINEDAMKASAGALNTLPICREKNLRQSLEFLQNSGFMIIACTEKTENTFAQLKINTPVALVMGNEENGIANDILKLCTHRASIPMRGQTESLNVAVAAGMGLYEIFRQIDKQ